MTMTSGMSRNCSSDFVSQIAQVIGEMLELLSIGLQRGCWRDLFVGKQISYIEIISTVVLLAMVVESSRVFHVVG